mmetsp:Transcript_19827/g.45143  ORF Transcript_19827/g.45143 Transcript_19827/m.45143 type:complete len:254 (-) Transcript_19827:137-898(-)
MRHHPGAVCDLLRGSLQRLVRLLQGLLAEATPAEDVACLLRPVAVELGRREHLQDLVHDLPRGLALHEVLAHSLQRVELVLRLLQLLLQLGQLGCRHGPDLVAFEALHRSLLRVQVDAGLSDGGLRCLHSGLRLTDSSLHFLNVVATRCDHLRCNGGLLHGVLRCIGLFRSLGHDLLEQLAVLQLRFSRFAILLDLLARRLKLAELGAHRSLDGVDLGCQLREDTSSFAGAGTLLLLRDLALQLGHRRSMRCK